MTKNFFSHFTFHASRRQAFTLAEVLITLGIIGVVAAITLPTLIKNYQNAQYVTSLKKSYTEFNQVLQKISADHGCVNDLRCTGLFSAGTSHKSLGEALVPYFNTVKICGADTNKGCWAQKTNINYDGISSSYEQIDGMSGYKFVTNDGISISVENYANGGSEEYINCNKNISTGKTGNLTQFCGYVKFDVNGIKPPNTFGKDTFGFFISNGKGAILYPRGGMDDNFSGTNSWWKNSTTNAVRSCYPNNKTGTYCTGRVIEEGWQMNY